MNESITTNPIVQDMAAAVLDAMEQSGLSQRAVAAELGTTHPELSRWLRGAAKSASIDEAAARWLTSRADAANDEPAAGPADWIETPTSERIMSALAYAQANRDMVCIVGSPGVGKTYSIKRYQALYRDVFHATITPACTTVVPALEEIAEAVGLREVSAGARHLARAIRARVRDTRALLVIDEFQLLSLGAIEELRAIHDAEGLAVALVGNEVGYARMSGARAAHHAQIYSRLGMRLHITPPGPRDVRAIAERAGVTDAKGLALLERIGARPGGLRSVGKVIRIARTGGAPTFDRLKGAADNLGADE